MKPSWLGLRLAALLLLAGVAGADHQLRVTRTVRLYRDSTSASQRLGTLDVGDIVTSTPTPMENDYVEVVTAQGERGWVYRHRVIEIAVAADSVDDDGPTHHPDAAAPLDRPDSTTPGLLPAVVASLRGDHAFAGYPKQGKPGANYAFTTLPEKIGYVVGYSETRKTPLWASYRCDGMQNAESPGPRPSKFRIDNDTLARVSHDDYSQSDYFTNPKSFDRGHMAPNFAIGSRYGRDAQLETFLMSNVCPQRSTLNQQPWEALEKRITDIAFDCGEVWVTVGPIFSTQPRRLNSVAAIPKAFYAIIVDDDSGQVRTLAVTFSQEDHGSNETLRDHWTTVDDIEVQTGLDFLTGLEDGIEEDVEHRGPDDGWDLDSPLIPTPHNH